MKSLVLVVLLGALAMVGAWQFAGAGDGIPQGVTTTAAAGFGVPPVGPGAVAAPPVTTTTIAPEAPLEGLRYEVITRSLEQPVYVTAPPGDERLFVLEKAGTVRVIVDGDLVREPFLDITDLVGSDGAELGLLGLAFHPGFAWNGRFFVYYTDVNNDTRLVEYRVSDIDPNTADHGSGRELLALDQPQQFHQGGMLQFGLDGYLWLSSGDGGGIGDQYGNGQDPTNLFGTIVRIDVDHGSPYAIPPDNPYVGTDTGAPEVWAYGLRNPWRVSIDPYDGLLYVADVGQFEWEEVSVVPLDRPGANFGWPVLEGNVCFDAEICDDDGMERPVVVYNHQEGCAIIGGFVYRGVAIPELNGHYFYGDWCGQWIRSFRYEGGQAVEQRQWTTDLGKAGPIHSLGQDSLGELYVVTGNGALFKIVPDRGST